MANDFELLVSKEKFDNRVETLQNNLTLLQGYASRYEDLKEQTSEVFQGDDENIAKAKRLVEENLKRVYNAIAATEEAIKSLNATSAKFEETTANVGQAFEDAIAIAANLAF